MYKESLHCFALLCLRIQLQAPKAKKSKTERIADFFFAEELMHVLNSHYKPSSGLLFCTPGPRPCTMGGQVAKTNCTEVLDTPMYPSYGQSVMRKVSILEGIFSLENDKSTAIQGLKDNIRYLDEQVHRLHAELEDLKEQLSGDSSVSPSSLGLSRRKIFRVTSSILDGLDSDDGESLKYSQEAEEVGMRRPGLKLNMNYIFGEQ